MPELLEAFNHLSDTMDDYEWLGLDPIPEVFHNPFFVNPDEESDPVESVIKVMMDPNYLHVAARLLLNIDLLVFQTVALETLWKRTRPILIAGRGCGKSFILSVYILLRMIFQPGCKVVIVGSAFRQSRQLHDYMVSIYEKSPILQDIVGKKGGPKREIDRCEFRIGDSICYALPLGDGTKIRGIRANCVIADEFASISPQVFNVVVQGFGVVSADPVGRVKQAATIRRLKRIGKWNDQLEKVADESFRSNQLVMSGTAYYQFNHFYQNYVKWVKIIRSKGDPEILKEIFGEDQTITKGFRLEDYAVLRIPFTAIDPDFLDDGMIAQAKATLHNSQFMMEMGACLDGDTEIITNHGLKKIVDIEVGDMVLTHKGRFRKIYKKTYLPSPTTVQKITTDGSNTPILVTNNHPFWIGQEEWTRADRIGDNVYQARLKELTGLTEINIKDYVSDVKTVNANDRRSNSSLATKKNKSHISSKISLDHDFGIILGYYVSKGSVVENRTIEFILDGDTSNSCKQELLEAFDNVFGKTLRCDVCDDNVVRLRCSSRIIATFIKSICLSVSHTKLVDHDVLFSNPEFLRGFIIGYWHANDHMDIVGCADKSLLCQIKLALSFFGIGSSLRGQVCNNKPTFYLELGGENVTSLIALIDGNADFTLQKDRKIVSNDEYVSYRVIDKETVDHSGLVYNLEVEDDHSYSLINATVHNCFPKDTDGFFRRSVIEAASTHDPVLTPNGNRVQFRAIKYGHKEKAYVIGVDPAADQDNAAMVVLEVNQDHRRIVYVWTTNKKKYLNLKKNGNNVADDYYYYIARQIRNIMSRFNTERIIMDKHGGGGSIAEALQATANLLPGEVPIYEIIEKNNEKWSDNKEGLHILQLLKPTPEINSDANHGMLRDLQEKMLLFPMFDTVEMEKQILLEKQEGSDGENDTYEEIVEEIEELKNEMSTIVITPTSKLGMEHFDTPEIKIEGAGGEMRKGRLRKDRYSALLYANYYTRNKDKEPPVVAYRAVGASPETIKKTEVPKGQGMYYGPGIVNMQNSDWTKISRFRLVPKKNRSV